MRRRAFKNMNAANKGLPMEDPKCLQGGVIVNQEKP